MENKELFDDISKEDLQKLKNAKLIREVIIKEKKTKDPIVILYSLNNPNDEIDKLNIEENTTQMLKDYWE